jgi:hypothetical protein
MTAFALVDPTAQMSRELAAMRAPALVAAHTRSFVSVDVGSVRVFGVAGVRYPTAGPHCNAGQLEVKTFDSSPALTNQIGFTVIVP